MKQVSLKKLNDAYQDRFGFVMPEKSVVSFDFGLSPEVIENISKSKQEPTWMRDFRLQSLQIFYQKKMPTWGPSLAEIDFAKIRYFIKDTDVEKKTWDDVPKEIKDTFDRLGVPQAEKEFLAGVKAQYNSEVAYSSLQAVLDEQGVIFCSMEEALRKHKKLFKEYFATLIPATDNKFAALNSAAWSGGSFVYIPKNTQVKRPLQSYFRINAARMGQFERTLIIADEGSSAQYVEGCTAPVYSEYSLHAAVVEVFVKKNARFRYSTIQNWSGNIYNLVTKRAKVFGNGVMEWVDGNLGAKTTMKYPSCYLVEEGAYGEMLSIAYAKDQQIQDTGAKMLHLASNTSSKIIAKSVSVTGGQSNYRGLVYVDKAASNCKSKVECDALILDAQSSTNTFPDMKIFGDEASVTHEASVSEIEEEKLFYLMSRG
ncbi:MAG TPA: Fe-S cluster assembly protein SufB, partial [Candidatus Woesebacteria bacterium]|nr:Fe-S cluster assembly protein SufB [Candidatus Woesebacteria bacterium]